MEKPLTELTDQELLEKKKKAKSNDITNAVIIGMLAGITIYSAITNGLGLVTFIPVLFAIYAANQWKKNKATLQKELDSRNLK